MGSLARLVPARRALRRAGFIAGAACGVLLLQLGAGAATAGCDASTTGQRITLHTRVTAGEEATKGFDNSYGWSIQLTKAYLSVGELYYFDGVPVVASLEPRRRAWPRGFFGVREAHAHPGHYTEGDAVGQMLSPATVDLLTETDLQDGEGVTGPYLSARFEYASPPAGDLAGELGGKVVLLEGEATKGGVVIPFHAEAAQSEILNADGNPYVEGCVFDEVEAAGDGTVVMRVSPSVWLDQVDFSELEAAAGEGAGPVDLTSGDTTQKAFSRGLQKGTGFTFSFIEDESEQ